MWSGGKPYCYKCATVIWLFDEDGLAMQANDHVELARNVEIGGKLETVRVRFPTELLRFGSPQANAIIEASFAKAIRNFQPATKAWIAPY